MKIARFSFVGLALLVAPVPSVAQLDAPPLGSTLPKISRMSAANAAGVLRYCAKNGLVSTSSADAVLNDLASQPDNRTPDYSAGEGGKILGDDGRTFAIAGASGELQLQACAMVLRRAKSFRRP